MPSWWQDQKLRVKGYMRPWGIIVMGVGFLFQTRPTWLGGTGSPELMGRKDYIAGRIFDALGAAFKSFEQNFTAVPSLVASAHGTVLEVGPGIGTQISRYNVSAITHIYGVELNPALIAPLLSEAEKAGLQGKYAVILGAVEDEKLLAEYGLRPESFDSIVCVGTLCSVENPEKTVKWLYELLRPGGMFIFWEHRRSFNFLTRLVQDMPVYPTLSLGSALRIFLVCANADDVEFWNPVWRFVMGGCELNRSLGEFIRNAGEWEDADTKIWGRKGRNEEWSIMPRVEGKLVKKAER